MNATPARPHVGRRVTVLALAWLIALALALALGAVWVHPLVVLTVLWEAATRRAPDDAAARIVLALRLPRVAAAAVSGALLGVASVALQGSLRNRLAEPATAGPAAGALLGATAGLMISGTGIDAAPGGWQAAVRIALAGAGAIGAVWLVVGITSANGRVLVGPLLLGGLAVNAFVGSLAALALFLGSVGTQTAATVATSWVFGGVLAQSTWPLVTVATLVLAATVVIVGRASAEYDQLSLGHDAAASVGVDVRRVRAVALWSAGLAAGAAVAVAGVLAFVGLVSVAVARRWFGPNHARVMPAAVLAASGLVAVADALGRIVSAPGELPAGVVTAAIGAPVLLLMLRRWLSGSAVSG